MKCVDRKYLLKEAQRTLNESDSTAAFCLCQRWILKDAIELLKDQEPKQVIDIVEFFEGMQTGKCPSCARSLVNINIDESKFCKYCGQAVKWNE